MAIEDSYGKILATAHYVLRKQVSLPQRVNRQTTEDLSSGMSRRGVVHFEVPPQYVARDVTPGVTPPAHSAPVEESSAVACPLDHHKEVDFVLTDKDLALLENGDAHANMKIATAAGVIAAELSESISAQYKGIYGYVGTAGTTPFASAPTVAQQALVALTLQEVPLGMRQMVLSPVAYGNAIALPQMAANQRGDGGSVAYIEGQVPRTMGFDWSQDMMLPTHTTGAAGTVLVDQADVAIGDTDVHFDGLTTKANVGDIFSVAGDAQTYTVLSATNLTGNDGDMTFSPAAKVAWANDAAVTFRASHAVNLAFHPYAFGFASAPEIVAAGPDGRRPALTMIDPITQIALTLEVRREYHQWGYYLSCLWGAKLVNPRLAIRVAG